MPARKDIITEEVYTRKMNPISTAPADDSPGDSEFDAGAEFQMGIEYTPNSVDNEKEAWNENEEILDAEGNTEEKVLLHRTEEEDLPDSARVVSANQPSPWMDREKTSDTN